MKIIATNSKKAKRVVFSIADETWAQDTVCAVEHPVDPSGCFAEPRLTVLPRQYFSLRKMRKVAQVLTRAVKVAEKWSKETK